MGVHQEFKGQSRGVSQSREVHVGTGTGRDAGAAFTHVHLQARRADGGQCTAWETDRKERKKKQSVFLSLVFCLFVVVVGGVSK